MWLVLSESTHGSSPLYTLHIFSEITRQKQQKLGLFLILSFGKLTLHRHQTALCTNYYSHAGWRGLEMAQCWVLMQDKTLAPGITTSASLPQMLVKLNAWKWLGKKTLRLQQKGLPRCPTPQWERTLETCMCVRANTHTQIHFLYSTTRLSSDFTTHHSHSLHYSPAVNQNGINKEMLNVSLSGQVRKIQSSVKRKVWAYNYTVTKTSSQWRWPGNIKS